MSSRVIPFFYFLLCACIRRIWRMASTHTSSYPCILNPFVLWETCFFTGLPNLTPFSSPAWCQHRKLMSLAISHIAINFYLHSDLKLLSFSFPFCKMSPNLLICLFSLFKITKLYILPWVLQAGFYHTGARESWDPGSLSSKTTRPAPPVRAPMLWPA